VTLRAHGRREVAPLHDDARKVLVGEHVENLGRHHEHAAAVGAHAVADDGGELGVVVALHGRREVGCDEARDHRLVEHHGTFALPAVAPVHAAANHGKAAPLVHRCSVARQRKGHRRDGVDTAQRALGQGIRRGEREEREKDERAESDASQRGARVMASAQSL